MGMILHTGRKNTVSAALKYGKLYNWYAASDPRNIANAGWHVSIIEEGYDVYTLCQFVGGYVGAAASFKESGYTYWIYPNLMAANDTFFNARGAGRRDVIGETTIFEDLRRVVEYWGNASDGPNFWSMAFDSADVRSFLNDNPKVGKSIRLVKDNTTLSDGQSGTYVGNDGKIYNTICIGTQEWLSENLRETRYRNGDLIPEVTSDSAWASLTTGAWCYYNNDPNNE